jgi:hypothetical protein
VDGREVGRLVERKLRSSVAWIVAADCPLRGELKPGDLVLDELELRVRGTRLDREALCLKQE